ncbi:MAG: suppressor of fused domain protein [Chloroflexi bacterium]|uniref:Suppressor of fused domain protein n=1 Tax=Candidatus Chlorohelix allophototropha TaxID=3003348 RepID=A0A8T7M894_9CHLR|nr:suppressor of fused domain protein [Chloroflexota bacterium]WJW68109.1 suppressor of fused domain protein [Chloroflexota bacterium L227-S17]
MSLVDLLKSNSSDEWFQRIWEEREEKIYTELFGKLPETVIRLHEQALKAILGAEAKILPEWLHYGVIEIAPNAHHSDWLYVTTGFSQPWNIDKETELNPNGGSGTGIEIVVRTPERAGWAVDVLHRLSAYQIGVTSKIIKGKVFNYGDWMPLNGSIDPGTPNSKVRGILVSQPRDFQAGFSLPSGKVELLQLLGITGQELAYLLAKGPTALEDLLYEQGAAPVINPNRESVELPNRFPLPKELQARF